jgi:hypothetical protein
MDIQRMRQFVKNSNIEVNSNSNNDNALAAEIEAEMAAKRTTQGAENLNTFLNKTNYGNFSEFVQNTNNNGFFVDTLKPGMFNVTVNKNYDDTARLDLKEIMKKPILPASPMVVGISIEVLEIKGLYGRFQTGFRKDARGSQGSLDGQRFFAVDFKARIFNDQESKGVSFTVYKNGKIRYSGGFLGLRAITKQPDLIRNYIINNYTDRSSFLFNDAFYNNISGQFKVNGKLKAIDTIPTKYAKYGFEPTTSYEPEIAAPILYIDYQGYNFNMSENGVIQILGVDEPEDLVAAYKKGAELARKMNAGGEFTIREVRRTLRRGSTKVTRTTCPKTRTPPCKAGYTAKKNPQGYACCYKVAKKATAASPVKTGYTVSFDNKQQLKINGLQCKRYPKSQLITIARDMGIVGIRERTTVSEICQLIAAVKRVNPIVNTLKVGNKTIAINGQGNTFRLSKRICKTYRKADLVKIVDGLGIRRTGKETIPVLCSMIQKFKPVNSLRNKVISAYGSAWMNKYRRVMPPINDDVNMLKNKIGTMNVRNVDQLIRRNINALKKSRKASLDKKLLKNNGVNKNTNGTPTTSKRSSHSKTKPRSK